MWWWIAYGVVSVLALVPTARWIAAALPGSDRVPLDAGDFACVVLLAFVVAPCWPLMVPGAWLFAILRSDQRERTAARCLVK